MKMQLKFLFAAAVAVFGLAASADPSVSLGEVMPGQMQNSIKVNYTLDGVNANTEYVVAFDVTANGVTKGVTNAAAQVSARVYAQEIDMVALFGSAVCDPNATVSVSLIALPGVRLWENGPYFAECNVGATKQEEAGYFFWWEEKKK